MLTRAISVNTNGAAWSNPRVTALRQISPLGSAQNQPNLLNNLDCNLVTYHLVASSTMQTGCFTPTAFGLLDSDSDVAIFNGTDEGLPLLPYSAHQVLAPWPGALGLIALDAVDTGGSYISLYKNPLAGLQNQRNLVGQLITKQLNIPPELVLRDQAGQRLIINSQTMAFSDSGSWLIVETLSGSFVRINLATLEMVAFAPAFGSQGSPALLKSQVAVSSDGRYVAIENTTASSFKVYDLTTCGSGAANWQINNCQSHDYWPFINQQVSSLQKIRHVRFVNDGLLSFEVVASSSTNSGIYELAPTDSITSLTDYIGLGDSYTSGEGAFDYLAGSDTDDNMCHLSSHSYPLLLTHDLYSTAGGHSVACSGATINDVGSTSDLYRGQVGGVGNLQQLKQAQSALLDSVETNFLPGYVAQQLFVKRYQPRVLTVSVGGNDIGFSDILQNCVEPHVSLHPSDNTCYNTYEARLEVLRLIDRTVPRWSALYKQLLTEAPGTELYAIGYPQTVSDTGSCGLNVHLSKSELEFTEELTAYLNSAIQKAAGAAGVPYVDISQALVGHRLCEASSSGVAVNGLTAGTDSGLFGFRVFGKESYHPNALGQALIEQAILQQTHNLTNATGTTAVNNTSQNLLNAPKSGRTINTLVPDDSLTSPVLQRSVSSLLQVNGSRDGLQPNSTYSIRLDGSTGTVLITLLSDASGSLLSQITIPGSVVPGGHTIDITGSNQAGEPVDITQPIYVVDGSNDADRDGVADTTDSCPGAVNSKQDADQDGIDDTCDGFIGQPPASTDGGHSGSAETGVSSGLDNQAPGNDLSSGSNNNLDEATHSETVLAQTYDTVASFSNNDLAYESKTITPQLSGQAVLAAALSIKTTTSESSKSLSASKVLGSQTTKPVSVKPSSFREPTRVATMTSFGHRGLGTVFWLAWPQVIGFIIALLLLLILYLNRVVSRSARKFPHCHSETTPETSSG